MKISRVNFSRWKNFAVRKDREFYPQLNIRYEKFPYVLISRSSHHREIILTAKVSRSTVVYFWTVIIVQKRKFSIVVMQKFNTCLNYTHLIQYTHTTDAHAILY